MAVQVYVCLEKVVFKRRLYILLVPEEQKQRPAGGWENGKKVEDQDKVTLAFPTTYPAVQN